VKAVVIARFGGPEVLELRELPDPAPQRGEVLVRVRATAVNRADLLQRMGGYKAPADAPQDIPGLEYAGEVEAVGEGVSEWKPGDRVFGLVGGGGYAERLVAPARSLARMPDGLSFTDGAAIPEAFITAYDALVTQAHLAAGETVLIHAVGSGVGTAAVQLARAIGARSVGTARSGDKLARARGLGLDEGLVPQGGKFAAAVQALGPIDVVLDLVGGAYVAEDLACIAPKGRVMVVGLVAGARVDLDLGALLTRRVAITGTVLRSRPLEEKIAAMQIFARHVVPLVASGRVKAVVDRVLPLAAAGEAHTVVAANETFGKVVLESE
jgi:putative PIG3 family NAD(P)H quinone oxidoreductase